MRDRSNTVSPTTNHTRRIEVSIMRVPTLPTPEHLFMPLSLLYPSAMRTGDAGVSRTDQSNRDAHQRSQQLHARSKVPSRMAFPSDKHLWVFQGYASTRMLTHGDNLSGFTGKHLSLRTSFNAPVDAALLVHRFPVALTLQNWSKIRTLVAIAPRDGGTCTDVTAKPFFRLLDFSERDTHTHSGVPLPVFPEDFRTLVELRPWQGERAIDRLMFPCWYIEPAVLSPAGRGASEHNPAIEAYGLSRLLDFRAVNQFSLERSGYMSGFDCSAVVDIGTPVRSADELSKPLRRRAPSPFRLRKVECAIRVRSTKEARQESQRIGLIHSGIEAKLVGQVHGLHEASIANASKTTTAPRAQTREQPSMASERPLRLALLGAYVRPRRPRDHAGSVVRGAEGPGKRWTEGVGPSFRARYDTNMKTLLLFLLCVALQPVPLQPSVTYDSQGQRVETYRTPSGSVTYDAQGNRIERYEKPDGGSVWYGPQGERWESYRDDQYPAGVKHGN